MQKWIKKQLTRAGAALPARVVNAVRAAANYLEVGRWMHERGFDVPLYVKNRLGLFELVASEAGPGKVLCLEFGVFQGLSLGQWINVLQGADFEIHGFDSFEGLPETFTLHYAGKGHFSTAGLLPAIDNPRVTLHKGWFEDTVPGFTVPKHDLLVINMDADLYSSTILVLRALRPHIVPGTFIHFDDFSAPMHEMRAFADFLAETGLHFKVRGADPSLTFVLFQCVSSTAP
jgi:hypothetical protein